MWRIGAQRIDHHVDIGNSRRQSLSVAARENVLGERLKILISRFVDFLFVSCYIGNKRIFFEFFCFLTLVEKKSGGNPFLLLIIIIS